MYFGSKTEWARLVGPNPKGLGGARLSRAAGATTAMARGKMTRLTMGSSMLRLRQPRSVRVLKPANFLLPLLLWRRGPGRGGRLSAISFLQCRFLIVVSLFLC